MNEELFPFFPFFGAKVRNVFGGGAVMGGYGRLLIVNG